MDVVRRRLRMTWGLRPMLIMVLGFCVVLSVLSTKLRRQRLVNAFIASGWDVHYQYEFDRSGRLHEGPRPPGTSASPRGPEILRNLLGDAFFNQIHGLTVRFYDDSDRELFSQVRSLPDITFLRVDNMLASMPADMRTSYLQDRHRRFALTTNVTRHPKRTPPLLGAYDMAAFADLKQLKYLDLASSPVHDIAPLAELVSLTHLNLEFTRVRDVRPLSRLIRLRHLNLRGTEVADLQPLAKLANLRTLRLKETPVSDLTPLVELSNLQRLYLGNTRVIDVAPLAELRTLTDLTLEGTSVTDISALANCRKLRWLNLRDTSVKNVGPLSALRELQILDLRQSTHVIDVSPLAKLTALRHLDLAGTSVIDVSPLGGLTALRHLDLPGTSVTDITSLAGCENLEWIDLSDTAVPPYRVAVLRRALPNCRVFAPSDSM